MKKLLLLFAVLLSTISASAYDFEVDGIYYNVLSRVDMTCEVTHNGVVDEFGDTYGSFYSGDVVIPASVTYSGRTFSVTSIGERAFSWCSSLKSVVIPNSVTEIGDGAFTFSSKLTSVEIPNSLTTIGQSAFASCSSLTSVVIPNSVTKVGSQVFSFCRSLTSVVIGNSVTTIGSYAFRGCSSLTSVVIPNSVTSIGESAFKDCIKLTEIISLNTTPPRAYSSAFDEVSKIDCVVKVPAQSLIAYQGANGWKEFWEIVALTDEDMAQLDGVESVLAEGEKDARAYTLDGREARKGQRGLVIERGRKIIR